MGNSEQDSWSRNGGNGHTTQRGAKALLATAAIFCMDGNILQFSGRISLGSVQKLNSSSFLGHVSQYYLATFQASTQLPPVSY